MDIIYKYFPTLTPQQATLFEQLYDVYVDWNSKINVISRKDIELLYERHVLHSLGLVKILQFKPMTKVMDLGTGGGFPAIPLAIFFPDVEFVPVDSIGKKMRVVQEVVNALGLKNVRPTQARAEELQENDFDFVVSRAVAPLETLVYWTQNKFATNHFHELENGLLCLKGGELEEELAAVKKKKIKVHNLSDHFDEEYFTTKKVVYVQM
ncbi:MAG: 16S rRNA (guanine(527)-N(7))-methyltransferase RsmG [Bacteroidetes bacterium]|nr:MAG: 16S rRNA (guanine(527)-N(7))-methyltransferase RsmG [Bacteroidota bacterium]